MTEPSDLCVRCQYDLRGIANEQPCPECGLLAERSRRLSDRLRDTDPRYLRKLSFGVWLLAAIPLLVVGYAFLIGAIQFMVMTRSLDPHMVLVGFTVISVLFVLAIWWLTTSDQRADNHYLRWTIRYLAMLPLVCMLLSHLQIHILFQTPAIAVPNFEAAEASQRLSFVLIWVWMILFPVLFFMRLRSIARRLISSHMMEHSAIVGIGWSVSMTLMLGIILLTSYAEELDLGWRFAARSNVWMIWMVIVSVGVALFSLWTIYLIIRFVVAFAIESHALRQLWREADRSGVTSPPG